MSETPAADARHWLTNPDGLRLLQRVVLVRVGLYIMGPILVLNTLYNWWFADHLGAFLQVADLAVQLLPLVLALWFAMASLRSLEASPLLSEQLARNFRYLGVMIGLVALTAGQGGITGGALNLLIVLGGCLAGAIIELAGRALAEAAALRNEHDHVI